MNVLLQCFGLLMVLLHRQKRKVMTNLILIAAPVAIVFMVIGSAALIGDSFDQTYPASTSPTWVPQRWAWTSWLDHAPLSSDPKPFSLLYTAADGVTVGTLPEDSTAPATGLLADVETANIGSSRSPYGAAYDSEDAINAYYLAQWDNAIDTLGAVSFSKADASGLDFKLFTNDTGDGSVMAVGIFTSDYLLPLSDLLTNAWMQLLSPGLSYITHYTVDYPRDAVEASLDLISVSLVEPFGLAVHIMLPFIIGGIALDRALGLRNLMTMMGLKRPVYWSVNYVFAVFLSLVCCIALIITGLVFNMRIFVKNNFFLYALLYIAWSLNISATALAVAPLIPNVMAATVVGWLLVFILNETAVMVVFIADEAGLTNPFVFIPSVAFHECTYILMEGSKLGFEGVGWASVDWRYYLYIAVLLATVIPQLAVGYLLDWKWDAFLGWVTFWTNTAISRLTDFRAVGSLVGAVTRRFRGTRAIEEAEEEARRRNQDAHHLTDLANARPTMKHPTHPSVETQREAAEANNTEANAVVVQHLKKRFKLPGGKRLDAVNDVSFTIPQGTCLAVLGPNGAGKTTTINMLCGLMKQTSGNATIVGYKMGKQQTKIHRTLGVCPQFDRLWPDLTAAEHMAFYGRVKGMWGRKLRAAIKAGLEGVSLYSVRNDLSGTYSGGMKRRLSVAISMIGNPSIVVMDEPTTGLDPASRRQLWSSIRESQGKRTFILTTHSMEEAEALGNNVAIIVDGKLKCLAPAENLKEFYGSGYKLVVTSKDEDTEDGADAITDLVLGAVEGATLTESMFGTRTFSVPTETHSLATVFESMSEVRNHGGVEDWGLSDTTLEQVFVIVSSERDDPEEV
ncbi:ABC transporter [Carpediemonas membranifera]|uniref:ABC transporter n=1 Tax=Carpediemonas membranifera TaxID=201153 RepID=A0A8J6AY42_9EUKA|nr:ABC transporter [Carpediemonas membranifera]|eukprot:KAG9390094.1 ABC transporter [Carpediemonas membranifera]